jgi:hypothetical protein
MSIKPNARIQKVSEQLNYISSLGVNIEALAVLISRQVFGQVQTAA